jgi:hypothetical protein
MTRRIAARLGGSKRLALQVSGLLTGAAAIYVAVAAAGQHHLVDLVLGHSFTKYAVLVAPVAAQQVAVALGGGADLFLRGAQCGQTLLRVEIVAEAVAISTVALAALAAGLTQVAWALALAAATSTALQWIAVWRYAGSMNLSASPRSQTS